MLQVTEKLLQEMTNIIVGEVKPRKIILFGSHARGTARADSDLDFIVVEDGPFDAGDNLGTQYSLNIGIMSPKYSPWEKCEPGWLTIELEKELSKGDRCVTGNKG